MTLLQLQTETEIYWTESFTVTEDDLEYLFSVFLEDETPLTSREIARLLVQYRAKQEAQTLRRQIDKGESSSPRTHILLANTRLPCPELQGGRSDRTAPGTQSRAR